ADVYIRSRDFEHARPLLDKVAQRPFFRAPALDSLAVLEFQENGRDRVDLLREAAQLAPKNWAIQKRYIAHLDERGETIEAIRELRALLETQWFRADSWALLGQLLRKINQPDLARDAFARTAAFDMHWRAPAAP